MSTTTELYRTTLAVPHASEPTYLAEATYIDASRPVVAGEGQPATTSKRQFALPPLETWTLEALRMVLWDLSWSLPNTPDEEGWARNGTVVVRVRKGRGKVVLSAERKPITGELSLPLAAFTDPMQAALDAIPTAWFPLKGILQIKSVSKPITETKATASDVHRINRLVARLKEELCFAPEQIGKAERALRTVKGLEMDDEDL